METASLEYSAASTVTTFDPPVPLLRGPILDVPSDDPLAGPYVLAFRDPQAWASALKACEAKLVDQCEHGARVGCAIAASNKCKIPWWRAMVGPRAMDLSGREKCEEREMEGCVLAAKEKCIGFARDKCAAPFRDARIVAREGRVRTKDLGKLIAWASVAYRSTWMNLIRLDQLGWQVLAARSYRASELLGFDSNFEKVLKSEN
jgi:hypothetical protein